MRETVLDNRFYKTEFLKPFGSKVFADILLLGEHLNSDCQNISGK